MAWERPLPSRMSRARRGRPAARRSAEERLTWLAGRDARQLPALCRELGERMPKTPAARAAVDIALHDLFAKHLGLPLADVLGRAHESLPTSITIGIKPLAETLAEAEEYVLRGFRILKVKIGRALEEDIERLVRLREKVGSSIGIRADANQGYTRAETLRFFEATAPLGLEFVEQPVKAAAVDDLRALPEEVRRASRPTRRCSTRRTRSISSRRLQPPASSTSSS